MMKPFENLNISAHYLRHNVTYYAHGHATQPDGVNAAVKALESTLQAFDFDDYDIGGDAAQITDGINTVTASEARSHLNNSAIHGDSAQITDGTNTVTASEARALLNRFRWYGLRGDGTNLLAQGNNDTAGMYNKDVIAIRAVISVERLSADEQVFRREKNDGTDIWIVGKGADNKLYFECNNGVTTVRYSSTNAVFSADSLNIPIDIGVQVDRLNHTIAFFYDGNCEATQATSTEFMNNTGAEWFVMGGGLQGALYELSVSGRAIHTPGQLYSPYPKGFDLIPACLNRYDVVRDMPGASLLDRKSAINLSVAAGSWVLLA